jgi:hypothetical protein
MGARAWRAALLSLAIMTSAVAIAAWWIASQQPAIDTTPLTQQLDGQWIIRSGRAETNRLVLEPAANSIGTALHPIDSPGFTLQARINLADSAGSGGLIVQADDDNYFTAFLISADGYFRVSDYRNGAWIDRAAWRAWPHLRREGALNALRAACEAGRCTFFVNDEWTWQEDSLATTSKIGLVAAGTAAQFDQVGWHP